MKMKRLHIIKVGSTYASIARRYGDFDAWTAAALGPLGTEARVVDAEHGAALPAAEDCSGVVITGSHAMVTDDLPWSTGIERWIPPLIEAGVPVLGICYGHQLLARAMGGRVGYHPLGEEIGTVEINLLDGSAGDPLFGSFPPLFFAHAAHSQTVLSLPPNATPLAANAHEPHHAFRLGDSCAWGVQFHPEYDETIMRLYIMAQSGELMKEGRDVLELMVEVSETPVAAKTLTNFARIVQEQEAGPAR